MPTIINSENETPPVFRSELEYRRTESSARWGAVLAGVLVAASGWLVLHLLGMGIGMTSIDPDDASSLRASGIGVGVWSAIAPILALFAGGLVASKLAPSPNHTTRVIHGALVWSIATLLGAVAVFFVTASLLRTATSATGAVADAAATAAGSGVSNLDGKVLDSLGLDADDLVAPLNERLRAEGKPPVTAAQIQATAKEALRGAVRSGDLDRQALVTALARNTALSKADVEELATRISAQWEAAKGRAAELGERAQHAGLQAAESTGKAFAGISLALLLGLAAAIGGALATGRNDRRRVAGDGRSAIVS